ncbi:MAG: hypothetical protein ABFS02_06510 [Pseudomonadota bacterium]
MLPAASYNLTRILLRQTRDEAVFVPIRSMLYLAVVDDQEIIFLDGAASRRQILLAWQNFCPGQRNSLEEPVAYEAAYYSEEAPAIMPRLLAEFPKALIMTTQKRRVNTAGQVVPLKA